MTPIGSKQLDLWQETCRDSERHVHVRAKTVPCATTCKYKVVCDRYLDDDFTMQHECNNVNVQALTIYFESLDTWV